MLRLLHHALVAAVGAASVTILFMAFVLTYTVEPDEFTWFAPAAATSATAPEGFAPACQPIILAHAPIGYRSIADFATEAVLEVNSYDYLNWDSAIPGALNRYFTPEAAQLYYAQFQRSRLLTTIQESYYTVTAIAIRPAMVVSSGLVNGTRTWDVQVPVTLYYQTGVATVAGGTTAQSQTEVFALTVIEQSPSEANYRGVAVNAIATTTVRAIDDLERLQ